MGTAASLPELITESAAQTLAGDQFDKTRFDLLAEDGQIRREKWEQEVTARPDAHTTDGHTFDVYSASAKTVVSLRGGEVKMPIFGLGGGLFNKNAEEAVVSALQLGYRLIDTAPNYGGSEAAIGRAIQRSGIKRSDIFLATKVGNNGYDATLSSFEKSLAKLQTTQLDLLLMHSSIYSKKKKHRRSPLHASKRLETWRAMQELRDQGKVRAIGVCNHSPRQIELLTASGAKPDVLQVEYHPLLQRGKTLQFCREQGIVVQGYGNGGGGWRLWRKDPLFELLQKPPVQKAAREHGRSAHQISLRWSIEQGLCVIPKSASGAHQAENLKVFDFELTTVQKKGIQAMDKQRSLYRFAEPDTYL